MTPELNSILIEAVNWGILYLKVHIFFVVVVFIGTILTGVLGLGGKDDKS